MAIKDVVLDTSGDDRVFGLLVADAGVGKTTQATTFPINETRIISAEEGLLSLRGSNYRATEVDTFEDVMSVLQRPNLEKYIIIDSLTELYEKIKSNARDKFTASQNFAKHEDIIFHMFHIIKFAKFMRGRTIFFLCHTKEEKDGMVTKKNLCFDGKLPELVKKEFDLIVHLEQDDNGKRYFLTSPDVSNIAKGRLSPWMGQKLEEEEPANLYKLCQKLLGH